MKFVKDFVVTVMVGIVAAVCIIVFAAMCDLGTGGSW